MLRRILALALALPLSGAVVVAVAQGASSALPTLPTSVDTFTVSVDGAVIGRGITTWTRVGLEHLQVYVWTNALDSTSTIDSLFSDPFTLLPVREVRVVADTTFLVQFGLDTLFISRLVGATSVTAHNLAPGVELYSSASIDMLAASMPFRAQASRSALVFFSPPAAVGSKWVVFVVHERKLIEGRRAWRVMANTRTGSTTFWIDEATRRILQMDVMEGDTRVMFRRPRP